MASSEPQGGHTMDGVHRYPPTGLKVLISGAGVGGMLAALECWRKGFDVEILEQNAELSAIGDFFSVGPSAWSTLHHYPKMLAEYGESNWNSPLWWCDLSGKKLVSELVEWNREGAEPHAAFEHTPIVGFIKDRPKVMRMLEGQIMRLGIPFHYGQRVVRYEESKTSASVHTANGQVFTGDIVVAAEGIGTKSHEIVTGRKIPFVSSGYAILRGAFDPKVIAPGSKGASLLLEPGQTPEVRTYFGENMHLITLFTHDKVGVAFTHKEDGTAKESWSATVPGARLVDILAERTTWGDEIMDLISQIPDDTLIDWKLTWRDPQPQWASAGGRIVQLGDSAHAFLPSSANGATQAMEDGISLGECLYQAVRAGESVSWATKVHNKLRFQRVSVIQQVGIVQRYSLHHVDMSLLERGGNPFEGAFHLGKWIWQHKPEDYARERFGEALEFLKSGKGDEFENKNLPPGHVFSDWTVAEELEKQDRGIISGLRSNGDWSR